MTVEVGSDRPCGKQPDSPLRRIAKSRKQRAESREQRAECREQRAENREQRAECRVQSAESREQRAESREQSAECRVQRAESREQRAECREQKRMGGSNGLCQSPSEFAILLTDPFALWRRRSMGVSLVSPPEQAEVVAQGEGKDTSRPIRSPPKGFRPGRAVAAIIRRRPRLTPIVLTKATSNLLAVACAATERVGAVGVLVIPAGRLDWEALKTIADGVPLYVAVTAQQVIEQVRDAGLIAVAVEPTDAAIIERITLALIEAVAHDLLRAGARVVVVYSGFEADELDSMTVVRLGEHLERLTARDLRALESTVPFETMKAVVDVAVEIGREGREGKAVGTLIVVGDVRNVATRSRTLGFDPFRGYRRKERNVRDLRVREAIKEIAQLDGAFIVARDGTVEAACQIIDAPNSDLVLPRGLGTRHWAAAAITHATGAIAIVVSQSTGMVRLFKEGEIILRIAPMRHARAMKWTDVETEPPVPPRPEKSG